MYISAWHGPGSKNLDQLKKTRATHFTYKASRMVQNQNTEGIKSSRKGSKLNKWNEKDMQKALEKYCQKKSEE